jgi:hypothetical protein
LLKTSSAGDSLWYKTYGGQNFDEGNSVRQTANQKLIIAGTTSSRGSGKEDVWLIKTDSNGDTIWTRTFGGDSSDVGNCMQITNDGGYIIVGSTASYGAGGDDVWLIKTDSIGVIQWTKTFGDTADDNGSCVQQTVDTGFIISGSTMLSGDI